jgi:putative tryptophan/tyrosine transport system substrate-binding protein
MDRRKFIMFVGGTAAAAWPLAGRGQQPAMPVVGFLSSRAAIESAEHVNAFRQGLNQTGYTEGHNVTIEYRWADGRYDQLPSLAAELVARRVTAIAAVGGNVSGLAAKASTEAIPIVFVVGDDPVNLGLVSSLSRPGGNATGISVFTTELGAKRLEILRELLPNTSIAGLLINSKYPGFANEADAVQSAARRNGLTIVVSDASTEREIEQAFVTFSQQRVQAALVSADALFVSRRDQLVTLAAGGSIPTMYDLRDFVTAGGLMSYGTSFLDAYRQVGAYIGRILKGEKPGDLPVQRAVRIDLVLNLRTAKTLGLTFPPTLLARADEVIE